MNELRLQPRARPDSFLLEAVELIPGGDRFRASVLNVWRIASGIQESQGGPEEAFWLAIASINEKEKFNRESMIKKLTPGSRNIRLDVGPGVAESVYELLCAVAKRKETNVKFSEVRDRVADALKPACNVLGYGRTADLLTYRVTEEVVAATANQELQKKLRYWLTQGDMSSQQVGELQGQLVQEFTEDADVVISALKATGSQDHLSAIAMDVLEEKVWVSVVNGEGDHLKVEAYKFLGLLENPRTGRLLHEFDSRKWQSTSEPFVFKDHREGQVSGCFVPENCELEVAHVLNKGKRVNDRGRFYLEREYLACLYLVLARLREDREQITRLLENAEGTLSFDPFEAIKNSHH